MEILKTPGRLRIDDPLPRSEALILYQRARYLNEEDQRIAQQYIALTSPQGGIPEPALQSLALIEMPRQAFLARGRRLVRRLMHPTFIYVLSHLHEWGPRRRHIAELLFIQGCSQRETARRVQVSLHTVRVAATSIRTLVAAQPPQDRFDTGGLTRDH